ncbi:sodium-dependent low-affinity dicarboxylate transporter 1-like [Haemaphysalis longicornis]
MAAVFTLDVSTGDMSFGGWLIVMAPVVAVSYAASWCTLYYSFLWRTPPDDEEVFLCVKEYLGKKRSSMTRVTFQECVPLCYLSSAFMLALTTDHYKSWLVPAYSSLDGNEPTRSWLFAGSLFALLLSMTPAEQCRNLDSEGRLLSSELLRERFPWGALLVCASGACLSNAFQDAGTTKQVAQWLIDMPGDNPVWLQCTLAVASALIAEVVSANPSLHMLLPVAANMAQKTNSSLLYFAIPVMTTVETSLVLPTCSLTRAVIEDYVYITPASMILTGLTFKCAVVVSTIISVNTIGYIFI